MGVRERGTAESRPSGVQVQIWICEIGGCGQSAFVVSGICLAVDRSCRYCGCLFLQRRSSRNVMSRSCYSSSSLALLVILSFLIVWFVFVRLRFLCHHKGSGSHVHFCPRPCSSTKRWAKLSTHRHKGDHTQRGPCSHAPFGRKPTVCVIATKRLGSLPLARIRSKTWVFLRRLHI